MLFEQYRVAAILLVVVGGWGSAAQAMPDDYVAAIQADADEFGSGAFAAPPGSSWIAGGGTGGVDDGTANLEAFESFLKRRLPGTYILFVRLPEYQKTSVWEDYLKTGDLGSVRSSIFALRSGRTASSRDRAITNVPRA